MGLVKCTAGTLRYVFNWLAPRLMSTSLTYSPSTYEGVDRCTTSLNFNHPKPAKYEGLHRQVTRKGWGNIWQPQYQHLLLASQHPKPQTNMETSNLESLATREKRIANDKLSNFKGAARVSIQHLEFPCPTRQIDRRAIRQLIRDFDGEGCNREKLSHRIPAIINNSILQAALEKISLTAEDFRAKADHPPLLKLGRGVKVECLHGQHRVLAAAEHLAASHQWWVVDIYGTGSYTYPT